MYQYKITQLRQTAGCSWKKRAMFKWVTSFRASGRKLEFVRKVFADHVTGKGPSYYVRTLQFTASTRQACTERAPLTAARGRPCVSDFLGKVAPRFDGRLYTARDPFKDLISLRGWIKIRTSSFLESKCIIVRFRAMVARTARRRKESLDCYYCCRCFRESHWRVVVQPRPLDVETSVPTTRIERTLALLSDSHAREAARRWVGCATGAAQNSCSFERHVFPPSNADVKRELIASAKKRLSLNSRSHRILRATNSHAMKNRSPPASLVGS